MGTIKSKIEQQKEEEEEEEQQQKKTQDQIARSLPSSSFSFSSSSCSSNSQHESSNSQERLQDNHSQIHTTDSSSIALSSKFAPKCAKSSNYLRIRSRKTAHNKENMADTMRSHADKRYSLNMDNCLTNSQDFDKHDSEFVIILENSNSKLAKLGASANGARRIFINDDDARVSKSSVTSFQPVWQKNQYFRSFRTASRRFFRGDPTSKRNQPPLNTTANTNTKLDEKQLAKKMDILNEDKTELNQQQASKMNSVKFAFEQRNTNPFFRSLKSKSQSEIAKNKQKQQQQQAQQQNIQDSSKCDNKPKNGFVNDPRAFNKRQTNGYSSFKDQSQLINLYKNQKTENKKSNLESNSSTNLMKNGVKTMKNEEQIVVQTLPQHESEAVFIIEGDESALIESAHDEGLIEYPSVINYVVEGDDGAVNMADVDVDVGAGETILNYENSTSSSAASYSANDWDSLNENQRKNDEFIESLKKQIDYLNKRLCETSSKDDSSFINELSEKIENLAKLNYDIQMKIDSQKENNQRTNMNFNHQKLAEDYYNRLSKQNEILLAQQAQIEQLRQHLFNANSLYNRQQQQQQHPQAQHNPQYVYAENYFVPPTNVNYQRQFHHNHHVHPQHPHVHNRAQQYFYANQSINMPHVPMHASHIPHSHNSTMPPRPQTYAPYVYMLPPNPYLYAPKHQYAHAQQPPPQQTQVFYDPNTGQYFQHQREQVHQASHHQQYYYVPNRAGVFNPVYTAQNMHFNRNRNHVNHFSSKNYAASNAANKEKDEEEEELKNNQVIIQEASDDDDDDDDDDVENELKKIDSKKKDYVDAISLNGEEEQEQGLLIEEQKKEKPNDYIRNDEK